MYVCPQCGQEIERGPHEPTEEAVSVCFSCFLDDVEYSRVISITEDDDRYVLQIRMDCESDNWWFSYSFDDEQKAMQVGEIIAEKIQMVLTLELAFDGHFILIGTQDESDAEKIHQSLQNDPLSAWIKNTDISSLKEYYESEEPRRYDREQLIEDSLCWRLAMWRGCNYPHNLRTVSLGPPPKGSLTQKEIPAIFNSYRGLSDSVAEKLQTELVDLFVNTGGFGAVETLGDIGDVVSEEMPVGSWLFPDLTRMLTNYARDHRELLSAESRRGLDRNEAGRQFEAAFRELCKEYDLEFWSGDKLFTVAQRLDSLQDGCPDYMQQEAYEERLTQLEEEFTEVPSEIRTVVKKKSVRKWISRLRDLGFSKRPRPFY